MTPDELRSQVESRERELSRLLGQRDRVESDLKLKRGRLDQVASEIMEEARVADVLNKTATVTWESTRGRIEGLVTRALKAVFPDRDYQFRMDRETKRNASSVKFTLVENDVEIDIWEDGGGGASEVIGFALRIAYLTLHRPKVAPVLFWDEPFRCLYGESAARASQFAKRIAEELGIRLVLITHSDVFAEQADQIIRFEKVGDSCKSVDQTVHS